MANYYEKYNKQTRHRSTE